MTNYKAFMVIILQALLLASMPPLGATTIAMAAALAVA